MLNKMQKFKTDTSLAALEALAHRPAAPPVKIKVAIWGLINQSWWTQETSSQKQIGFAESFCSVEVFKKLNQKYSSVISVKIIFLA